MKGPDTSATFFFLSERPSRFLRLHFFPLMSSLHSETRKKRGVFSPAHTQIPLRTQIQQFDHLEVNVDSSWRTPTPHRRRSNYLRWGPCFVCPPPVFWSSPEVLSSWHRTAETAHSAAHTRLDPKGSSSTLTSSYESVSVGDRTGRAGHPRHL